MNALTFRTNGQRFACNIEKVQSIENNLRVSFVPKMPDYVDGFVKQQGEVIPVLDLGYLLYDRTTSRKDGEAYIIYQAEALTIAFFVEHADQIVQMEDDQLAEKSLQTYSQVPYFRAIYDLEDELVTIIDFDILVNSTEGMEDVIEFAQDEMNEMK